MNSLEVLRKKLQNIQHRTELESQTFDFTDPKKWLKGNAPEDWLELINHVKTNVTFSYSYQKHNVLSDLFEQAFKEFEPRANKNNEAYAHLFVQYARLKSKHLSEDAAVLYNQARAISRKFAIVHIASAQFELERDDVDKAKKILQKALVLEAQPMADIEAALNGLKSGATTVYTSPQAWSQPPSIASTGRNLSSGSESTSEMQVQTTDQLSTSMSFSMPPPAEPAEQNTEPNVISSAVKKHSLGRKYRSETALDSVKHANSRVNTFLPGRVKKINLPFQIMLDENEEDSHNTTQESFKPIDTKNHTTNGTPGFNNHGHTSGYLSMTSNTCDSKIPMVKEPTKNCIEKKPEMPKPVEIKVQEQPRKPLAPKQLEPETPNNKQIPSVPSTPIPQLRMVTVNDQHYAILGVHGKGGSIEVYQCFDSSNKIVAIKCVNLDNTHEEIIEGYKNEIRLLKRLQYCDQVITMYDSEFKSDENKLYIVMESGRSEDLDSFFRSQMKNKKRLSDNLICCYWKIMVEAVKALHKEGIIHSDLKPANFLLVGGKLKLIDFGIAEALQQDKTSVILDTQIGTLNYTSPETIMDSCWGDESQGKKFKIGVKSDVWSLGCILYNLVYMRTPFQHLKQDFFKVQAIINPDFPIEFPDLPNEHLIDVMKKCLTRDPKERPSVDQLLSHPYLRRGNSSKTDSPQVVKPR